MTEHAERHFLEVVRREPLVHFLALAALLFVLNAVFAVDERELPAALGAARADDPRRVEERVRAHAEDPVREPGLRLHPVDAVHRAVVADALQVPPAVDVADDVQPAVRRPLGLEGRGARAPSGVPSAPRSATQSAASSHGMLGWSQVSQASRRPSGERRGVE